MIALYVLLGLIGFILCVLILHVLFLCAICAFVKNKEYEKISRFYRFIAIRHVKLALRLCRVKVVVSGTEKLENAGDAYLLVCNHRSNLDPLALLAALKDKKLACISKPENFKIPFVGKVIRKCLFLPIDRQNARNALKTINRAAELIKNGVASYAVYPEGTRSKSKNMLEFHDGVFKIAQKAGSAVVVAGVRGTENAHLNAPMKKTAVYLDILDVIDKERVTALSSHELADEAREKIFAATEGK